jgi:hypothetical protein
MSPFQPIPTQNISFLFAIEIRINLNSKLINVYNNFGKMNHGVD